MTSPLAGWLVDYANLITAQSTFVIGSFSKCVDAFQTERRLSEPESPN